MRSSSLFSEFERELIREHAKCWDACTDGKPRKRAVKTTGKNGREETVFRDWSDEERQFISELLEKGRRHGVYPIYENGIFHWAHIRREKRNYAIDAGNVIEIAKHLEKKGLSSVGDTIRDMSQVDEGKPCRCGKLRYKYQALCDDCITDRMIVEGKLTEVHN